MSEKWQKFFIVLMIVAGGFYVLSKRHAKEIEITESLDIPKQYEEPEPTPNTTVAPPKSTTAMPLKEGPVVKKIAKEAGKPINALKYVIDDGFAVVQGDVVVGEIVDDDGSESGFVKSPSIRLWKSNVIPFYIQPSIRDPERVLKALEMFTGTSIHFVPYTDQEDVMVFEEAQGVCKSYVGNVGGKQPLWIPPNCSSDDIAHEILHALGFVHEQNRTDRDKYIFMYPDNIEEQYKDNFVLLPEDLMKVSGLAAFDYESLMMYPPSMFSKNGQPTMRPRFDGVEIRPTEGLSAKDAERLNKAYGANPTI
jgi:hypothetical protein